MKSTELLKKGVITAGKQPSEFVESAYVPYLKQKYDNEIVPYMVKKFGYKNIMMVPVIDRIVISSSISNLKHNVQHLVKIYNALYMMTGVTPVLTRAKQSVSQFKLYKGSIVGVKCVLRRENMYEFIERLVSVYLPSVKGFIGLKYESINGNSGLNIGIVDAHIVREITQYLGLVTFGFTITISVKRAQSADEVYELLRKFDIPIKKEL